MSTASSPSISLVVPILNEAALLPDFLRHIQSLHGVSQIIICDGGSSDGSQEIIRSVLPQADFVEVTGGRHQQLNAALCLCRSDIFFCCAVDLRLQGDACAQIRSAVRLGAGHGCLHQRSTRRYFLYRVQERWAQLRSRLVNAAYMDQAPFWQRSRIIAVGGFADKGTYDTAELSRRIGCGQHFAVVPAFALSSCRAWEHGFWKQTLRNQLNRLHHLYPF